MNSNQHPQPDRTNPSPKGRRKRVAQAILCIYLGLYLWMTLQGHYIVAMWTSGGVKRYKWLPRGFGDYRFGDGDLTLNIMFAPVYYPDIFLWHTSARGFSGDYPCEPAPRLIYHSDKTVR